MFELASFATLALFFGLGILGIRLATPRYRLSMMFALVVVEVAAIRSKDIYFWVQMYVVFERNVRKLLVWAFSGNEWIFGLSFLLVVLTLTARFGNVFCGWICQTPAIHELIYLRRFTHRLPKKFDGLMKKLRYLVLAVFLVVLFLTRESVFSLIFRIGNHLGLKIFLAGRSITFASRCNGCGKAERSCRMGALSCPSPRSNKPGEFIRMDCIECGACIGACPKNAVIRN